MTNLGRYIHNTLNQSQRSAVAIRKFPNDMSCCLSSSHNVLGRENNTPNGIALKETADEVRAEQLIREEYCYRQLSTRWRMRTRGAMSGQVHTVCRCVLATFNASLRHTVRIQNIQTVKWIICLIKLLSVDVDWKSKNNLLEIDGLSSRAIKLTIYWLGRLWVS